MPSLMDAKRATPQGIAQPLRSVSAHNCRPRNPGRPDQKGRGRVAYVVPFPALDARSNMVRPTRASYGETETRIVRMGEAR
jgi:hypothetical protein